MDKFRWQAPTLVSLGLFLVLWLAPPLLGVKPDYLLTDILVFVLIVAMIFLISYVRQKPHLREPWREIFHRKLAMASLVVLSVYVLIGLLDSIHFRLPLPKEAASQEVNYSVQVLSLFDVMVTPLREHTEKTYSAPFAAYLQSKMSVETPRGETKRIYPRLKYGGAYLKDPATQKTADILSTAAFTSAVTLVLYIALSLAFLYWLGRRAGSSLRAVWQRSRAGEGGVPWHVILTTLGVIVLVVANLTVLSGDYHVLGTDKVGQDVLFLSLKSIRTGLVIGTLTTLVMLPFAILLGIMAGYFKGWIDDLIQYIYTTLLSIPSVLFIAAAILAVQVYIANHADNFETILDRADMRLLALCVVLGITSWTNLCRLLRGESLKVREMDYIEAATAFGVGHLKIILRHILPNVMHIVLIVIVLDFSGLVLAEAVLSYIGVGVDPSTISWGNMINSARLELAREPVVWWSLVAAFVFMFTLVLAANLFSDAVRDAFDPRMKRLVGKDQ
jgi:peptide/nickel transport system permease protein